MKTVTFNAMRGIGERIQEIRVTRPTFDCGGSYKNQTEEHVAWYPGTKAGEKAALAHMRSVNATTTIRED